MRTAHDIASTHPDGLCTAPDGYWPTDCDTAHDHAVPVDPTVWVRHSPTPVHGARATSTQPPWPALPIGPTFTGESGLSVTGSVPAPGQSRVTVFVSSGGVTNSPVTRTPEPPDVLIG